MKDSVFNSELIFFNFIETVAVLSAAYPEHAPFMSDETMLSTPGVEATDYTLVEYMNYAEQIKACCERLKSAGNLIFFNLVINKI